MNIESFKNEFKIYCETVENTKGLEFIKQHLFDITLNLETFIDDNLRDIDFNSNMQVIEEARRLSKVLEYYSELAEMVEEFEIREVWKIINAHSVEGIIDTFDIVLSQCYGSLCYKYNIDQFKGEVLSDEQFNNEKWYIDLCNLIDKYNIC